MMIPLPPSAASVITPPQSANPPRKSRPRRSCHGCFRAKVKCGKERPGCARCVTIGRECGYVDYDRDGNVVGGRTTGAEGCETPPCPVPLGSGNGHGNSSGGFQQQPFVPDFIPGQQAWDGVVLPVMVDGRTPHQESILGSDAETVVSTALLSTSLEWQQQQQTLHPIHPAQLYDHQDATPALNLETFYQLGSDCAVSVHNPSPPNLNGFDDYHNLDIAASRSLPAVPEPCLQDVSASGGWPVHPTVCGCFGRCLRGLERLEVASAVGGAPGLLDFDGLLALCLEALGACSTLLSCGACRHNLEPQTSGVLLASTLSRVCSFYLEASYRLAAGSTADTSHTAPIPMHHFPGGLGQGDLARGANHEQHNDDDDNGNNHNNRLARTKLLARHLANLDKVCGMYLGTFTGIGDDGGVIESMTASLVGQLKSLRTMCDWADVVA